MEASFSEASLLEASLLEASFSEASLLIKASPLEVYRVTPGPPGLCLLFTTPLL